MSNFFVLLQIFSLQLMIFITFVQAQTTSTCQSNQQFGFESSAQLTCFQVVPSSTGTISLSNVAKTVKYGASSLKWVTTAASTLRLKSSAFTISNDWLRRGGVKVWIYKESSPSGKTIQVQFKHSSTVVGNFTANDFKGWRGIWVKFIECKSTSNSLNSPAVIDEVNFIVSDAATIYIDKLEFLRNFGKQSRDKIVPPISPFGLAVYDKSDFWQQTYKWSQTSIPASPATIDTNKRNSLDHIKSRLKNWYLDETKTSPNFPSGSNLEKRWVSLVKTFKKAHDRYDALTFDTAGNIVGPTLFCRNCEPSDKFGDIMEKYLLPLALEYNLRSRANEVTDVATEQRPALNSGNAGRRRNAINTIAGKNTNMKALFSSYLPSASTLTVDQVKSAIQTLNRHRLSRINSLLDFVNDQGFADGSGLGSLDHEMNLDGAGFMHSLFLLSDSLSHSSNKTRLVDLINTAKWYNDFGEIYQSTFEFKGTTADRMITLMLFRAIIVLVMPNDNDNEVKAKIRDMEALVRWMNNALSANEGLGGIVKPDYLGYHHKSFYGSAYVPPAFHNAALVQYLLGGTGFALSPTSVKNIRQGLETLRLMAAKYSTPSSVSGRYPEYDNKAIIKNLPGFAYISVSYPASLPASVPTGISVSSLNEPEMFLRLYNDSSSVNEYLQDGKPKKGKYYFNSLGSLQIMEAVNSKAVSDGTSQEQSPEGHWSKNFAALSIHRRKDWAVTAKGFNRFVWDYETSAKENVYGLFASHGALLIANSEADLQLHDIENGWDWSKVPGTTTIALGNPDIDDLNIGNTGRFYNKRKLAGSLTFKGTMSLKNGLFGMNFKQPGYEVTGLRNNIKFLFKKSIFFFENLLVCLGSDVEVARSNGKVGQSTLFQDKLASTSSFIKVDGSQKDASSNYVHTPSSSSSTTLTDAKGNFYFIPSTSSPILNVTVKSQTSKTDDGKSSTTGTYGTAWFKHSAANPRYEYAVLIPSTSYHTPLADLKTAQESASSKVYKVLKKEGRAHVVQFLKSPKSWSALSQPTTVYVMFRSATSLPADGPIEAVTSGDCLIMVEETTQFVYLAISYPDLNLSGTGTLTSSRDVGEDLLYTSSSTDKNLKVTLRNRVQTAIVQTQVHGTPDGYTPDVVINGKEVRFRNLKNGFSVELKLRRM